MAQVFPMTQQQYQPQMQGFQQIPGQQYPQQNQLYNNQIPVQQMQPMQPMQQMMPMQQQQMGMYNQQYPQQYMPGQMQQPQMNMMPQQQPMMGMVPVTQVNPLNFMSAYDKLLNMKGVFVKQKLDLREVLTGCDTENKYMIYGCKSNGDIDKKLPLFKAKEKSDFFNRQCLSANCRPFTMKVEHESNDQVSSTDGEDAFFFKRECQCTILCFNRPVLQVELNEKGRKEKIGKVRYPFNFCALEMEILDVDDKIKYIISGSCCQLGVWCQAPCESCETVEFTVFDANRNPLSKLQKRTKGCVAASISNADNFSLIFPQQATGPERALLMASCIMLDFTFFEEKQDNSNQQIF